MKVSTGLRITGWILTIMAVGLIVSLLYSGLGTLANFRINQESVVFEPVPPDELRVSVPYETYNPGPFAVSPIKISFQLVDNENNPISYPGEYELSVPAGSGAEGDIKVVFKLKDVTIEELAAKIDEIKPKLRIVIHGVIGGITKFTVTVTQPLLGGG